jgi:hypothetical protein
VNLEVLAVFDKQMKCSLHELHILERHYKYHKMRRKGKYLIISPEEILTNTPPSLNTLQCIRNGPYRFSIKENATIIWPVSDI